jgi:hypothetical protein
MVLLGLQNFRLLNALISAPAGVAITYELLFGIQKIPKLNTSWTLTEELPLRRATPNPYNIGRRIILAALKSIYVGFPGSG